MSAISGHTKRLFNNGRLNINNRKIPEDDKPHQNWEGFVLHGNKVKINWISNPSKGMVYGFWKITMQHWHSGDWPAEAA